MAWLSHGTFFLKKPIKKKSWEMMDYENLETLLSEYCTMTVTPKFCIILPTAIPVPSIAEAATTASTGQATRAGHGRLVESVVR